MSGVVLALVSGATVLASTPAASADTSYGVMDTVAIGSNVGDGLAIDRASNSLYVANGAGAISVIDLTTNEIKGTIAMSGNPGRMAIDTSAHRGYVVTNGYLTVFSTITDTVVDYIGGFSNPIGVAVDPGTHKVFVANYVSQVVSVIDTAASPVTHERSDIVGSRPWAMAVDPTTHLAYVATLFGNSVSVMNGTTIEKTVGGVVGPIKVTTDPSLHRAYVVNNNADAITVIDTSTNDVIDPLLAGSGPSDIAVDPRTHMAFVTNRNDDNVSVIDQTTGTIVDTVAVGDYPIGIVVDPGSHRAYVTNGDQTVSVISAAPYDSQAITYTSTAPENAKVGGSYTPAATGGVSGNPVTFSTTGASCTVSSEGEVTFTHVGDCAIAADQIGDATSTDAPTVVQTVAVGKADQAITYTSTAPENAKVGGTYTPAATGGVSGNPVTFSTTSTSCTVSSEGEVTFTHADDCIISADQIGDDSSSDAPTATQTVAVGKAEQAITFTSLAPTDATVGQTYAVTTEGGGSAEPVSLSVDPSTSDACTITDTTVTFVQEGSCIVSADQPGSDDYSAAPTATQQIAVALEQTTTTVSPSAASVVFGQAATATATVTGTDAGSVQFLLDGAPVGDSVALGDDGTATSADLGDLTVGAHQVGAAFTPTDDNRYAGSTATPQALAVDKAATTSSVSVSADDVTATVAPTSPGAGEPTGTVHFSVAGTEVGTAELSDGTATLDHTVPAGSEKQVSTVYDGDDSFTGSSASTARRDPVITAQVSSAKARSHGWYPGPVKVTFTCEETSAALTAACPAPVTFSHSGAGQSVTRSITATDGGAATVTVSGIHIDRQPPKVRVSGVRAGATYFATGPAGACRASDSLSGVATCTVKRTTSGSRVTYVATATDEAGNHSTSRLVARTTKVAIAGASMKDGRYVVHRGRTYTVLVAATSRPTYVYAAPSPRRPAGGNIAFERIGKNRWALGVTFKQAMRHHTLWNIGTRVAGHTTVTTVRVVK